MKPWSIVHEVRSLISSRSSRRYNIYLLLCVFTGLIDATTVGLLYKVITHLQTQDGNFDLKFDLLTFRTGPLFFEINVINSIILLTFLIISRTLIAVFILRALTNFLSRIAATFSRDLLMRLLSSNDQSLIQSTSSAKLYEATSNGSIGLFVGVLSSWAIIVSESSVLILVTLVMFQANIFLTCVIVVFGSSVFVLHSKIITALFRKYGQQKAVSSFNQNLLLNDIEQAMPEIRSRRRFKRIGEIFFESSSKVTDSAGKITWLLSIPKYTYEVILVFSIGLYFVVSSYILSKDFVSLLSGLLIIVGAASRVVPSLLRLQSAQNTLTASFSFGKFTMELDRQIRSSETIENDTNKIAKSSENSSNIAIQLIGVSLERPGIADPVIEQLSLNIGVAEKVAFIGPSGSGKTTILEMLSGLLTPSSGDVFIQGKSGGFEGDWLRNTVGYLPSRPHIINGDLIDNLFLYENTDSKESSEVDKILTLVEAKDLTFKDHFGVIRKYGSEGADLSFGQRQRIGIARLLLQNPDILILDEPTSGLSHDMGKRILSNIFSTFPDKTFIVSTHDASLLSLFDRIIEITPGRANEMKHYG